MAKNLREDGKKQFETIEMSANFKVSWFPLGFH